MSPDIVWALRALKKPSTTTLAKAIATAERLREQPLEIDSFEYEEVNSRGYSTAQCRIGARKNAVKSNNKSVLRHFPAAATIMAANGHIGLLRQVADKLAELGINPLQIHSIANKTITNLRAEEKALWAAYLKEGHAGIERLTEPL